MYTKSSMIPSKTAQYYVADEVRIRDNVKYQNYPLSLELLQTLHFSGTYYNIVWN